MVGDASVLGHFNIKQHVQSVFSVLFIMHDANLPDETA